MELHQLDLNKLAVFCRVVDSGNYQAASEVLNVTPSAISQTMAGLESSLGFALFHRVGRKLIPTREGRRVYREFRESHRRFVESMRELVGGENRAAGMIRVGAYLEFAKGRLSPLITGFLHQHPHVQIKMTFDTPTRLRGLVESGRLDLCFSIFPARQSRSLHSLRVYEEELVMISPRGMLPDKPSYEDLVAAPMVEYYFDHQPFRRWLALHFNRHPKRLRIRAYAATAEMVSSLVASGLGGGMVPEYLLDRLNDSVRVVRPTARELTDHIWLLRSKTAPPSTVQAAFTDHVIRGLKNDG